MWPNKEESGGKTLQVCAKIDCQDLYAGLAVLARRTSDMTDRFLEIRRESGHSGNYIPSGRQLPRTPPFPDVKRHLDFSSDTDCENMEPGAAAQHDSSTFDFIAAETKTEPDDHSMLKGMTGYQLTPSDLEFIEKMQEDKIIKKLQRDLEEVQRLLQMEKMAAELVHASREKAQAELSKFPSCEELTEWVTVVLKTTSPSTKLTDVDTKSLLSVVTKEDIQRVVDEKRAELARLDKMVANKRKREAEERERLEKQIVSEQLKTQGLMSQLSDLKSELAQQELCHGAAEGGALLPRPEDITEGDLPIEVASSWVHSFSSPPPFGCWSLTRGNKRLTGSAEERMNPLVEGRSLLAHRLKYHSSPRARHGARRSRGVRDESGGDTEGKRKSGGCRTGEGLLTPSLPVGKSSSF